MKEPEKILEAKDICKAYGKNMVLNQVNLTIKAGEIYGLVGENGAGKSSLMKVITGLTKPTSGEISLFGKKNLEDERNKIGCLIEGNIIWNDTEMRNLDMDYIREHVISVTEQEPTLIADTIYNNIALYRKLDVKCIQRAVDCFGDSILKRDNWDLQINEKSSNISGGEKQKIAIIRQVVQDGQVMIFDEPTSAMDESGKKQFLQLIDQIKNHKIIIIVSHDNAILNTCDEILIL